MNICEITCKTALSFSRLPGLDYSLNPYVGCEHGCKYCYVPNVLKISRNNWGTFVDVRINMPLILAKELKNKKPGVVGISTVTDSYQPLEKKYKITRYCLEQLLKYDFPICIQTKSLLVNRDVDLITKFSDAEVMVSIGTSDDEQRLLLEPRSSSISDRLEVLKKFSETGVKTSVFFGPIYPTVSLKQAIDLIDKFVESGASEIMIDSLHMKPGIEQIIKNSLTSRQDLLKFFPTDKIGLKNRFMELKAPILNYSKERNVKIIEAF
ncbi:MAG: radical SAM protein [Candidatus Thermoplasmatota archaeon]|nr:radical SAM protein [Candidatus Thermoplasmatota archaeon]